MRVVVLVLTLILVPRLCLACLAGSACPQLANQQDSVQLAVSRTNPYAGEQIEFTLTIKTKPSSVPLTLSIPWLTPQEAWSLQFQQWQRQFTEPQSAGLKLRFLSSTFTAPQVKPGEYVLRWKLLVRPAHDEAERLRKLSPVQIGNLHSNTLTLEIQQPAARPPSSTVWDLGIGTYRVQAQWARSDVTLGEETTLIMAVEGEGPLESIPSPPLRTLPGWESDRFLLEAMPPLWKDRARWFPYRIRPRQLKAALPPVVIRYFDPKLETNVTQQINIPPLKVLATSLAASQWPGSTVTDAWQHLPAFRQESLQQHQSQSWTMWMHWLLVLPLGWAAVIIARQTLHYLAPRWLERLRWQRAARNALHSLGMQSVTTEQFRAVLADYYSKGLDRDVVPNWETLRTLAILTPRYQHISTLLEQLQECEFGPAPTARFDQVRQDTIQMLQHHEGPS